MSQEKEPIKVLIVEDNNDLKELYELYLSNFGMEIIGSYNNGQIALDAVEKEGIDVQVALLDIQLHGMMNGIELARRLREVRGNVGIVIVSANIEEYSLEGIADKKFQKPFDLNELVEGIRKVARKGEAA